MGAILGHGIMTVRLPTSVSAPKAKPFLKWAGGKTQLLSQYARYYPVALERGDLDRYIEPFLGSGAVFLDVVQRFPIAEAFLFDLNPELILAYRVVQRDPQRLLAELHALRDHYLRRDLEQRKGFYYQIRHEYNRDRTSFDHGQYADTWPRRAAQMVFLNKTCYNGLYRVNSKGEFNVPFGRYLRPSIVNDTNILRLSEILQRVTLRAGSFVNCRPFVNERTFVYFDPPYRPLTTTSNFTAYAATGFDDNDQIRLAQFYDELHKKTAARLMLSNSDPGNSDSHDRFFDELYHDYQIHRVEARRMINTNSQRRGSITELVITNYAVQRIPVGPPNQKRRSTP